MIKLLFLHWCHLQVQHCLGSAGVQDKSNCLKVIFTLITMTQSKSYDLWVWAMARPESLFSSFPGQLTSYQVLRFLDHLKEGLGEMGLVGPFSKPNRIGLHPKHRHRRLGALLTHFWCWSVHCLWWVIFKAWGALRNSASFFLVSLFFLFSFWIFFWKMQASGKNDF